MLCSVIIPTVGRDTLLRSVQSALAADMPGDQRQIIVVNDSGQPLVLTDWLADRGVQVIDTKQCGLAFACNAGAAVSTGKWLEFLHDDDYLLPGGLTALLDRGETTCADWIVGGTNVVDDDGTMLRSVVDPGITGNIYALLAVGEVVHMSDCLLRRSAFFDAGGFDPRIRISEDRDLECRLSLVGDVASAAHLVACVRVAGSRGSTYSFANIVEYSRVVRERAFDAPDAVERLKESVKRNVRLRGRLCRNYLFSGALNLRAGRIWLAGSRFSCGLRLAGWHVVQPAFWRGALHRSKQGLPNTAPIT